ncbi:hypothetical protein ELI30_18855 [Rhizobium leguminosarum]|uniref:SH3 domain-containing protein n=1 Tax=Rhizobium leguminosarum TaxID=384 RepID=UPI00103062BA|nr:SH3 domain-containing protein [Rhizobium leguminosarum]TAV50227.1 hypothetical protein ELI32_19555 [Rhizobium leguminosarum]TAV59590.1 hypothetical protein ELI31_18075 [Rhizobium leguminosarum]TAV70637.1 hypothetical protein ELI30_18855 [Rhizobium leguminosarum]TAY68254.1 hypothetical protein ELH82_19740 [Rhizobium leguminosarum]
MATPYKGFWLIVGMTAAAFVMANATSNKRGSSNYASNTGGEVAAPTRIFPSQTTPSITPSAPKPESQPSSTSAQTPAAGNEIGAATTVTRRIDQDIKTAFDEAVKVALATPDPAKTNPEESEGNEPDSQPQMSPLETREVSSSPKIFDEPAATGLGQPQEALRERVRTTTDLNLREGPDPAYLKVETLANGTTLLVLEKSGKWWRVKSVSSGAEGWINGTFVKPAD